MYVKVGFLLCALAFNVCTLANPRPDNQEDLEEPFDALRKSVEKIKTGLGRISALVKDMGSNSTAKYVCLPELLESDVQSETTSAVKVVKGRLVTVNETTWTDGQGEEVAFLRVTARRPLVSVSREEVDNNNAADTYEKPLRQQPVTEE